MTSTALHTLSGSHHLAFCIDHGQQELTLQFLFSIDGLGSFQDEDRSVQTQRGKPVN
jgi:hypothetical protein